MGPPPPPTRPRSTPMRFLPTPSPTPLPMTTPRPTSTLRRLPMVPAMSRVDTPWLFPMAESSTSSTPPTDMTDTSLMSPTREPLSTLRPSLMPQLQLQPTTLKPSLCFVSQYLSLFIDNKT